MSIAAGKAHTTMLIADPCAPRASTAENHTRLHQNATGCIPKHGYPVSFETFPKQSSMFVFVGHQTGSWHCMGKGKSKRLVLIQGIQPHSCMSDLVACWPRAAP
jgi:hypothetical protein